MQMRTHLIMWKTSSRKDGDLLSSGNAVHAIDGRDARLDHLFWIDTALRVDGLALERSEVMQGSDRMFLVYA